MDIEKEAAYFIKELPYKQGVYAGRNWGHEWHSLCSYHGKLKPAIAHFLVSEFTEEGQVVLDPLCGVGTIPFEAALQGRKGIGNDLSELAYCVSLAKLSKPPLKKVLKELIKLENYIDAFKEKNKYEQLPYKQFGLNHTLEEYFQKDTYVEIIAAREYLHDKFELLTPEKAMVYTCFLHVLHGNRPYALSRNSHPLTPYAPKGDYIYKNVIEHIREKIERVYSVEEFGQFKKGRAIYGDCNDIKNIRADAIITSPPFADSMKFYTQNWMRLWACGWEPEDFKTANDKFIDQKQNQNFDIYYDFFEMCYHNLKKNGILILHLGKTKKIDMAEELSIRSRKRFTEIYRADEDVTNIEKHGIKDKGSTVAHQYLFLQKK